MKAIVVLWAALSFGVALTLTAPVALAEQGAVPKVSIWSGVYTAAQGKRGEEVYSAGCAQCHGSRLNGAGHSDQPPSPAIAREGFLRKWTGQSVAELFVVVRSRMPSDNPGIFTDQQSVDAVAHMLAVSGLPAGDKELPSDPKALEGIVIEVKPK